MYAFDTKAKNQTMNLFKKYKVFFVLITILKAARLFHYVIYNWKFIPTKYILVIYKLNIYIYIYICLELRFYNKK